MVFKKGDFTTYVGETPEQLARRRAVVAAVTPKFGSAKTVGEGLGQLFMGIGLGRQQRAFDEAEAAGRKEGDAAYASPFGRTTQSTSGQSGPMNILGVDPGYAAPPSEGAAVADDTMAALGKTPMRPYRDAIAGIESAGSGDYAAIGPTHPKMGRALGRYQIMEANIGPWSKAALGREVSTDEFLNNPQIQDAVFDHIFGGYLDQYGPEGAAQAWFAGPGGVGKTDRKDVLGTTVGDYGKMFTANLGGPVAAPAGASAATNSALPNVDMNALMTALANPWLSPEQRANLTTIFDHMVQAGDPLRQIEVAKGIAELEKMNAPPAPPEELLTRMALLDAAGVDRNSPEGQNYLLTGEMPEVPEAGYNMLTPEEVARLGLPPGAYQRGGDGKISQIGKDGVTVNNVIGGEQLTPGQKKIDEAFADTYLSWVGGGAADSMKQIDQLSETIDILGDGGNITGAIGLVPESIQPFVNPDGTIARENVEEVVQRSLREILGAQFTEKEGERLIARAYNPRLPPAENKKRVSRLLKQIKGMAEAKQAMVDYFDENGTLRGYKGKRPSLGDLEDLMDDDTSAAAAPAAGGGATINGYTIKPVN